MFRTSAVLMLLAATALLGDSDKKPARRVRLGGIFVGVGYSHGPAFGPGWGYGPAFSGLYSPFWYSPWIHPGLMTGFPQGGGMGQIKLSGSRNTIVYLDGAYAGPGEKLKSIWLEPGVYNVEVREMNGPGFERKVYVLSGKTLDLRSGMQAKSEAQP